MSILGNCAYKIVSTQLIDYIDDLFESDGNYFFDFDE